MKTYPLVPLAELQRRYEALGQFFAEPTLVVLQSGEEKIRNKDVPYDFRAASNFVYLTGFDEPESLIALKYLPCKQHPEIYWWVRPNDPKREIWDGPRLGVDKVQKIWPLNQAWSKDAFEQELPRLLDSVSAVAFDFKDDHLREKLFQHINRRSLDQRQGHKPIDKVIDLEYPLAQIRLYKSEWEVAQLQKAIAISQAGHLAAMKAAKQAQYEYEIQAALEGTFCQQGSPRVAFGSIVASGARACTLHYVQNDAPIERPGLVLVDAGAEVNYYAGDITHCFPADGHFTQPQKVIYNLVLKAQQAAIAVIKPGVSIRKPHEVVVSILTEGLQQLGFIDTSEDLKKYFMHGTGHWLGMDVHDVGPYKKDGNWLVFQPGMVTTVEPGLYLPQTDETLPEDYRGIGVRIEDDVLVTEQGCEVLSQGLPRSVDEIEKWMAQNV